MNRLLAFWVRLFIRWMPDAFAVAILLTLLTFALAMGVAGYSLHSTVEAWGDGFWNLLTFTNQITLTLLFGYALANTPPMQRGLRAVAGWVRSARGAYALASNPIGRLVLLALIALPLWKGAHHLRSLSIDFGGAGRDSAVAGLLYGIAALGSLLGIVAVAGL